jgi:membrane protein
MGIIPIFMIGLYMSWLIVLFGAQVAYGVQNWDVYVQEKQAERINQRGKEFVALRIMTCAAQQFFRSAPPPSASELAHQLGLPLRLVSRVLTVLVEAGLLFEVRQGDTAYSPSRPISRISALDVLTALRVGAGYEPATTDDPARAPILVEIEAIRKAEETVASGISLQNLVDRLEPIRIEERLPARPVLEG